MIARVVSGGQTGVDRAALDVALELGMPCGGWCPQGRLAEDGVIDPRYPLKETPTAEYAQRTEWNVRDSDGTLVLVTQPALTGGTALTRELAAQHQKPCVVVNLRDRPDPASAQAWAKAHHVHTLNVAGPRETGSPGIYREATQFLRRMLTPPRGAA